MRIALYQIDGKLPNLALAKLARYHAGLGREVVRFDPATPWDHATYDRVYASKLFDFSPAPFLSHKMEIGGPGWGDKTPLPDHIEKLPPLWDLWPDFTANMGFTARGCRFSCGFCVVPKFEGRPNPVATIKDLMVRESNFLILLDNDLFGNPDWRDVFNEIRARNLQVNISQGVNLRVLTEEQACALASIRFRNSSNSRSQVNTAWDNPNDEERFLKGFQRVIRAGIRPWQIQVFVLVGYQSTPEQDLHRVETVLRLGADPYVMPIRREDPYQGAFARWVNARICKKVPWAEYVDKRLPGRSG